MADGFEQMIHEANAFFAELAQNNTRAWYEQNKTRYVEGVKQPAEFFLSLIAEDLARVTGDPMTSKLFCIHRDVRFSKDKTPYNTHLHLMWSPVEANDLTPRWFFGMGEGYFMLGLGVMGLKGAGLTQFRAFIDAQGEVLTDALETAAQTGRARLSDWGPAPLKRVPRPYAPDHPHGDFLKRKSLTVSAEMPKDWEAMGLIKAVNLRIQTLLPIYRVLQEA